MRGCSPASQIASSFAPLKFLPTLDQLPWSTCSGEPQKREPTKTPSSYLVW